MAQVNFTTEEIKILNDNPYVLEVSKNHIFYSRNFKELFIKEYMDGNSPTQIFRRCGLGPEILGAKRIERAAYRWKKAYTEGELGKELP